MSSSSESLGACALRAEPGRDPQAVGGLGQGEEEAETQGCSQQDLGEEHIIVCGPREEGQGEYNHCIQEHQ